LQVQATDAAGNKSAVVPFAWTVDTTPPVVVAAFARAADAGGWYNHPVSVSFSGSDALSTVTCDAAKSYNGPESGSASVSGSCTDAAGNVGTAIATFKYDATAPSVSVIATRPPDSGGGYRSPGN